MPDSDVIASMTPKSFKDCGLGSVVLVGDATDILTEGCNTSVVTSSEMHSDKTSHDVAMGLAFVTGTGYVALACDLFCGRTSEQEACKTCSPVFKHIHGKHAVMYDKGVAKLQVHLPNMNQAALLSLTLTLTSNPNSNSNSYSYYNPNPDPNSNPNPNPNLNLNLVHDSLNS